MQVHTRKSQKTASKAESEYLVQQNAFSVRVTYACGEQFTPEHLLQHGSNAYTFVKYGSIQPGSTRQGLTSRHKYIRRWKSIPSSSIGYRLLNKVRLLYFTNALFISWI